MRSWVEGVEHTEKVHRAGLILHPSELCKSNEVWDRLCLGGKNNSPLTVLCHIRSVIRNDVMRGEVNRTQMR